MKIPAVSIVAGVVGVLTLLVSVCSVYAVVSKDSTRPGHEIVEAAQSQLDQLRAQSESLKLSPVLPDLDLSWTKTLFLASSCGLTMAPIPDAEVSAFPHFSGAAAAWRATVTGPAISTFSCLLQATNDYPVLIDTVSLNSNGALIQLSIIGRNETPKL